GVLMLEQVIASRRREGAAPDIDAAVARLQAVISESAFGSARPTTGGADDDLAPAEPAGDAPRPVRPEKARTWRFEFVPTPALSERGVNVNSVRARLQGVGEILQATPHVRGQGGIVFEFVVTTDADESAFEGWREENLTYTPFEEPAEGETRTPPRPDSTPEREEVGARAPFSASAGGAMLAPSNVVRVDLARLDDLMRLVGELVTSRARMEDGLRLLRQSVPPAEWRALQETSTTMARLLRDLREGVMRVRMVQVGEIFERMKFVVRDLTRESGKEIKLELQGQETEIDKFLVERMMDPLLHLVRNAVSHGLETVAERVAAGKPPEGRLTLRAATAGDNVLIEIADDGRGVDAEKVLARARGRGLVAGDVSLDDELLLQLICTPGFSTRDEADRASGRGVGMDVVGGAVAELGGTLKLSTERGRGSRFTVELPLTLAVADALIASVGGQRFAFPQSAVREIIEVEPSSVKVLENNEIVPYRGGVLPLLRLARLFDLGEQPPKPFHVFVTGGGAQAVGLAVERVVGQREIVVRGLNDPLVKVAGVAGATDLGDGRVVLILDVAALRQAASGDGRPGRDARARTTLKQS
ncbi:MAG TPA: chemotaxis protein CheA, partial [Pyrinomonadaceae bacterium]